MRLTKLLLLFALLLSVLSSVNAQSNYNPHKAFAPLFYSSSGNKVRAANGAPGSNYWQNSADYKVEVKFDTATKKISGQVTISYTNNSPDNLPELWLQLVQNINQTDSRFTRMHTPGLPENQHGFHIHRVEVQENGDRKAVKYLVDGTRMQIRLPEGLKADGGKLKLVIQYDFILQRSGAGGRSGYMNTQNGRLYEVSYWYPRMCVYDDLQGWNTLPFIGNEFYLDYGDINYQITLPAGMIVAACGSLENPEQVLTRKELARMKKARNSDKTVMIRGEKDLSVSGTQSGKKNARSSGWLTWHFHMSHTRDVAWAASEAFLWDAARINLPSGKHALAMSYYPVESAGKDCHGRGTEYLKGAVELFSKHWFPYPYSTAINVAGKVGGMEFPGLAMDWWKSKNKSLYALISHEIGHSWFPMIVGSNERRFAWMDEGFNTFIDLLAQAQFNKGEYAPKRDGEYAPGGGNPAEEIVPVITKKSTANIMTPSDGILREDLHPLEYFKAAFGLVLLRNVILGHKRFDYAFRKYIADWAYKHPSPMDFFREMENKSGEDLDWFWRSWFFNNWKLDQAVEGIKPALQQKNAASGKKDWSEGAIITIANLDKMPMPVIVKVTESDGHAQILKLPVQIWEASGIASFKVATTHSLKSVVLDPDHQLPDVNRSNNSWER